MRRWVSWRSRTGYARRAKAGPGMAALGGQVLAARGGSRWGRSRLGLVRQGGQGGARRGRVWPNTAWRVTAGRGMAVHARVGSGGQATAWLDKSRRSRPVSAWRYTSRRVSARGVKAWPVRVRRSWHRHPWDGNARRSEAWRSWLVTAGRGSSWPGLAGLVEAVAERQRKAGPRSARLGGHGAAGAVGVWHVIAGHGPAWRSRQGWAWHHDLWLGGSWQGGRSRWCKATPGALRRRASRRGGRGWAGLARLGASRLGLVGRSRHVLTRHGATCHRLAGLGGAFSSGGAQGNLRPFSPDA